MAEKTLDLKKYIDLTDLNVDLAKFRINKKHFNCVLKDAENNEYKGFMLAKSSAGKAYTVVDISFQKSSTDDSYPARLTLRRTNEGLEDKPINKGNRHQRISMESGTDGYREFWKMIGFLSKFDEVVDGAALFGSFQFIDKDLIVGELKKKGQDAQRQALVDYIEGSDITVGDMASILTHSSRAGDLDEFMRLLDNKDDYIKKYREKNKDSMKGPGNEAVWNYYLSSHKWIFGLGLSLRFMDDFINEAAVGISDSSNSNNPKADMLGWSDFTVTVEIKTPEAKFFTENKNSTGRAATWSFTSDFIDGISQVLSQKEVWTASHKTKDIVHVIGGEKNILDKTRVRTIDPKAIFIYGNKESEIPRGSPNSDLITRRDTLERFIRNNRNMDIISFDELYRRAYHIVYDAYPPNPKPQAESRDP